MMLPELCLYHCTGLSSSNQVELHLGPKVMMTTNSYTVRLKPISYAQKFTYYSFPNFPKILPIVFNLFPNHIPLLFLLILLGQ